MYNGNNNNMHIFVLFRIICFYIVCKNKLNENITYVQI